MTITIREAVTAPAPSSGRMLIQLITPGDGSSGVYSEDVLRAAAEARVFDSGTLMFADHPSASQERDLPERSIRDVAGVLTEAARWDGTALVAEARVYEPWAGVLVQMHDAIGVSIRATARVDEADDQGRPIIAELVEGLSVDFVTYPGRGGAIREVYESRRPTVQVIETAPTDLPSDQAGTTKNTDMKETPMGTIELNEAEHQRLTERAGQVETLEAERDTLTEQRDAALAQVAEAHREADAASVDRVIAAAGVEFTALEAKGLRADLPKTDAGRLDVAAFEKQVSEAAAEKQSANGAGRPNGVGVTEATTYTEDDYARDLGITKGA